MSQRATRLLHPRVTLELAECSTRSFAIGRGKTAHHASATPPRSLRAAPDLRALPLLHSLDEVEIRGRLHVRVRVGARILRDEDHSETRHLRDIGRLDLLHELEAPRAQVEPVETEHGLSSSPHVEPPAVGAPA